MIIKIDIIEEIANSSESAATTTTRAMDGAMDDKIAATSHLGRDRQISTNLKAV